MDFPHTGETSVLGGTAWTPGFSETDGQLEVRDAGDTPPERHLTKPLDAIVWMQAYVGSWEDMTFVGGNSVLSVLWFPARNQFPSRDQTITAQHGSWWHTIHLHLCPQVKYLGKFLFLLTLLLNSPVNNLPYLFRHASEGQIVDNASWLFIFPTEM